MDLIHFEKKYNIHVFETGPDGKLNPFSLFNFLQDIASEHAVKLGFGREDLLKQNHFWVLSRIFAKVEHWPEWSQDIIVRTWPRGIDKLFAIRDFEVRTNDGKVICSATSSWLIVDTRTKRVQRPDGHLAHLNPDMPTERSTGRNAEKVEVPSSSVKCSEKFKIKVSDLDVNLHTNNTRYVKWVTDTYNLEFTLNHTPVVFEVNYLAESVCGEDILIKSTEAEAKNSSYYHSVYRHPDNKELCRIRIEWN